MKNIVGWIIGIVIVVFIFNSISGLGKYEGQSAEEWFNQYDEASAQVEELNTKVEDLQTALQDANYNIEQANSSIDNAKSYEEASYDDMVEALSSLETVSTVDEP